jgi:hypothetical protein
VDDEEAWERWANLCATGDESVSGMDPMDAEARAISLPSAIWAAVWSDDESNVRLCEADVETAEAAGFPRISHATPTATPRRTMPRMKRWEERMESEKECGPRT